MRGQKGEVRWGRLGLGRRWRLRLRWRRGVCVDIGDRGRHWVLDSIRSAPAPTKEERLRDPTCLNFSKSRYYFLSSTHTSSICHATGNFNGQELLEKMFKLWKKSAKPFLVFILAAASIMLLADLIYDELALETVQHTKMKCEGSS